MRILYITSSLTLKANSASIRNVGLINGLIKNNIKVDILTINWPKHRIDPYLENMLAGKANIYRDDLLTINKYFNHKTINQAEVTGTDYVIKKVRKSLKEFIVDLFFFPDVDKEWIYKYRRNLNYSKYDAIISSSDTKTSHFVGGKIKEQASKSKWVQIWGDPWAEDIGIKGFRKLRAKKAEIKILKKADSIFYVSIPTLNRMKMLNREFQHKMNHIPRGYVEKVVGTPIINANKMYITYTGVISKGRNIIKVLEAIKKYNYNNNNKFILKIYGSCDNETDKILLKYSDIVIKSGPVSFQEVVEVYKNSAALLFLSNKSGAHQIPGKLFDYFGTNRSILSVVEDIEDPVSNFIKETRRSILVKNEVMEIVKGLKDLEYEINNKELSPLKEFDNFFIARNLLIKAGLN